MYFLIDSILRIEKQCSRTLLAEPIVPQPPTVLVTSSTSIRVVFKEIELTPGVLTFDVQMEEDLVCCTDGK